MDKNIKNEVVKRERFFEMKVEEYFRELDLMEKQYVCEEELYPFINMFLRNGKDAKDISIRTVADMTSADTIPGRMLFSANISFPDIAILHKDFELTKLNESEKKDTGKVLNALIKDFDSNYTKIFGCVEAKQMKYEYFVDLNNENMQKIKIDTKYLLVLKPQAGNPNYNYTCMLNDCHDFEYDSDAIKWIISSDKWKKNKTGRINEIPGIEEVLNNPKRVIEILDRKYITVGSQSFELDAVNQLFGELFWYGKVVYTDGLKWKYLEVKKCQNIENQEKAILFLRKEIYDKCIKKQSALWYEVIADKDIYISCQNIANLTEGYNVYKTKNEITEECDGQWNELINGLAEKQWLPQPEKNNEE